MHATRNWGWFLGALVFASAALAGEGMPVARQNAMVQKYCAVCHTDAAMNGGVSLEHFDAATAAPSLKAMMLSKVTGGALLETVQAMDAKPEAAAFVSKRLQTGAMAASGVPEPDMATIQAFALALAKGATGSTDWTVDRKKEAGAKAEVVTASILREAQAVKETGLVESYRLILACNPATKLGTMQAAWAPAAHSGTLAVSVDAKAPVSYVVEGKEKMGNANGAITNGLAAIYVADAKASLPMPGRSLALMDLAPGERVVFPFGSLSKKARKELAACFPVRTASR